MKDNVFVVHRTIGNAIVSARAIGPSSVRRRAIVMLAINNSTFFTIWVVHLCLTELAEAVAYLSAMLAPRFGAFPQ